MLMMMMAFCLPALSALGQNGASATVTWTPSPDPAVVRYVLYYWPASMTSTGTVQAGNVTNATVTGLAYGTGYYFACKAVDSLNLTSIFSNTLYWTAIPAPPANLRSLHCRKQGRMERLFACLRPRHRWCIRWR